VVKTSKHPRVADLFETVLGRKSMALSNGAEWKSMRATFSTAFASANIFSLMPAVLEESELFVSLLSEAASRDGGFVRSMGDMLKRLSFDLVCRLVLGRRLRSQVERCELADLLHAAARWPNPASLNPFERLNVVRIGVLRCYESRIKRIVDRMVLDRWAEVRKFLMSKATGHDSKIIIDMALKAYSQNGQIQEIDQDSIPKPVLDILSDK
jgi:cytochrome P450